MAQVEDDAVVVVVVVVVVVIGRGGEALVENVGAVSEELVGCELHEVRDQCAAILVVGCGGVVVWEAGATALRHWV
jgi:hypothetical protein